MRSASGLSAGELADTSEGVGLAVVNVLSGMVAISGLYLFPMYLVGHWYRASSLCLGIGLTAIVILRITWYRNLPPSE